MNRNNQIAEAMRSQLNTQPFKWISQNRKKQLEGMKYE